MAYLVVVWLLASGQFQGEPWREFASMAECEKALPVKSGVGVQRMLFISGCLDKEAMVDFRAISLKLSPSLNAPGKK